MENANGILESLVRLIDVSFARLRVLTGFDFLDVDAHVSGSVAVCAFADWMRDFGDASLEKIRTATFDCPSDDDLLDAIDYNTFALGKSVATDDPEIIYAALADVIVDVATAIERARTKACRK